MTTALERPKRRDLFFGFFLLGISGFGGVLPLTRDALVSRRRWLSEEDFDELLSLCQLLPGGNVVNLSVAVGMRLGGLGGALAAISGLLAAPSFIVIMLASAYGSLSGRPGLASAMGGLAAAGVGLIIAMVVRMAVSARWSAAGVAIAGAVFFALCVLRQPLVPVIALSVPLSFIVHARRRA